MADGNGNNVETIVLDYGSSLCRGGLGGEDAPSSVFPSVVGRPKHENVIAGAGNKDVFVGEEAREKCGVVELNYPMQHRTITNWDDMERVWQHAFYNELRLDPEGYPVLLTEPVMNANSERAKTQEIMFEGFNAPALYQLEQGIAVIYSCGTTTGIVLDCGDGGTHVVPVWEGIRLPHAVQRADVGGRALNGYMAKILTERGISLPSSSGEEIVRELKEKLGFVSEDFEKDMEAAAKSSGIEKSYVLPDGNVLTVGDERFRCAEALFQPSLLGVETPGIHKMLYDGIMRNDIDLRRDFFYNVLLCGGSTMFPGFQQRMQKELAALAAPTVRIAVVAPPERKYSVWIGASILSSLSRFRHAWMTKAEYNESGPQA